MSVSSTPPPGPWVPGEQEGYSCLNLEIQVVQDDSGWVFSRHEFQSPEDALEAEKWQTKATKQIAFALVSEALRREAYLCMLVELSKDPELAGRMATEEALRDHVGKVIALSASETLKEMATAMLPDIAKEVIHMVVAQQSGPKTGSKE